MKKIILGVLIIGLLTLGLAPLGYSETLFGDFLKDHDIEVGVSGSLDFYNQYVWRGFLLDADPVLQLSLTLSVAGFEGGIWSSFDVAQDDGLNSDEVDGWIGYNFDLSKINEDLKFIGLSVGNTWYSFPGADGYTKELYITISLDTLLSPYFTWCYDYGEEDQGGADGNYYNLGIGHSFTLIEDYGITLDLGYELGFNNKAFIEGDGGYNLVTADLTVPLTDMLTMSPAIGYSSPFGDLADDDDGAQKDELYAGVSMGFEF